MKYKIVYPSPQDIATVVIRTVRYEWVITDPGCKPSGNWTGPEEIPDWNGNIVGLRWEREKDYGMVG